MRPFKTRFLIEVKVRCEFCLLLSLRLFFGLSDDLITSFNSFIGSAIVRLNKFLSVKESKQQRVCGNAGHLFIYVSWLSETLALTSAQLIFLFFRLVLFLHTLVLRFSSLPP